MRRIIILRGKPTAGKSTAFHNLQKRKEMKKFLFVDHCSLKNKLGTEEGKRALFLELKKLMPTRKDIIIEEMSKQTLRKNLNYYLKKYKYKIIVFQFEVSKEEAYRRDKQRAKENWHPRMGKKWVDKMHKFHEERFDRNAILVDCNKLDKREVVDFIIKNLK
jgi:predicted kinase